MNDIAKRIAEIMKKKKISASDLSKKINVQKSSISHILSGRNKPSLDFVVKLSDSFSDINVEWLINGEKSTTPSLNSKLLEKNNNGLSPLDLINKNKFSLSNHIINTTIRNKKEYLNAWKLMLKNSWLKNFIR